MSEETPAKEQSPKETSAEETRLRERRSFDDFNEAQAKRRQKSRERNAIIDKAESGRWHKSEADPDNGGEKGEQASPGG